MAKKKTARKSKTRVRKQRVERPQVGSATDLMTPGSTGLRRMGDRVYDDYLVALRGQRGIKAYREMQDGSASLGSYLYTLRSQIQQAKTDIEPYDDGPQAEQQAEHVEQCLEDMSQTTRDLWSEVLSMAPFGHSLHGIYYKIRRGPSAPIGELRSRHNDGLVGWRKMPIRSQDTIDGWDFQDDGGIDGAWQIAPPNYKRVYLPIEQHLLFRIQSNKANPEGRSLFRNAYSSWFYYKKILELLAIGIERDLTGLLVFEMPLEYFATDATSDQTNTVDRFRKLTERARRGENEGLTIPTPEDDSGKTGYNLKQLEGGSRPHMDTLEVLRYLDSRMLITVLGDSVLLGNQGDVGSWALSSSKTKLTAIGVRAVMASIEDVFNLYAIPRLIERNGWPVELAPRFSFGDIETDDAGELMTALSGGTSVGLITPDRELERYLRVRMGLPLVEDISDMQFEEAMGRTLELEDQNPGFAELSSANAAAQAVPIAQEKDTMAETVSAQEAADMLGVSRNVINRAVTRGDLPGRKIGSQVRIMREDLVSAMRGKLAA